MNDTTNLREVQLKELELLKKFKEICEAEHIQYYLVGGTLLGAIRHKGFIPWDDDVDVAMMRPDYEKFLKVAGEYLLPGQAIKHYSLDSEYYDYTMKLVNENVFFVMQQEFTTRTENIWIDIFPLDGTPDNPILRRIHFLKLDFLRMLMAFHLIDRVRIDENRSAFKKILVAIARNVRIGRWIDPKEILSKMDKEYKKKSVINAKHVGNHCVPDHDIAYFPYEGFGEGVSVSFEDGLFTAPRNYDLFLKIKYNQYMRLPPEEKQVPKHHIIEIKQFK